MTETKEDKQEEPSLRRLPLWRSCLEDLLALGVDYGSVYEASWFEKKLSVNRLDRRFGIAVHRIRCQLEERGFYLQGHVMRDGKLVILPPEKNVGIVKLKNRRINKDLHRAANLLQATNTSLLPKNVRTRHQRELNRAMLRIMLFKRAQKVGKLLKEKAPKLLEPNGDK